MCYGGLIFEDKVDFIGDLSWVCFVVMVGEGINDSVVLVVVIVGIVV